MAHDAQQSVYPQGTDRDRLHGRLALNAAGASAFELFGHQHAWGLFVILVFAIAVPLTVKHAASESIRRRVAVTLAVALVAHEIFKVWFHVVIYDHPAGRYLPLHLCGLAALLMAWVLARRSYAGFEVAYFWGLAGSSQALLTPDIQIGFPSLIYLAFFVGHGLVITSVVFAIAVFDFRPSFKSVLKTIKVTLAFMVVIAPLNYLLDANYLYLRHKPLQASIIDYLGPWPWYIGPLILVGAVMCFVYYLPFGLYERLRSNA